jgi:hypothetical protein
LPVDFDGVVLVRLQLGVLCSVLWSHLGTLDAALKRRCSTVGRLSAPFGALRLLRAGSKTKSRALPGRAFPSASTGRTQSQRQDQDQRQRQRTRVSVPHLQRQDQSQRQAGESPASTLFHTCKVMAGNKMIRGR